MPYASWFDTQENRALLAICARKLIRNVGLGGIVWGVINLAIGIGALFLTFLNVGLVVIALLMLGAGVRALLRPDLKNLLAEAVLSVVLFVWNLGITLLNGMAGAEWEPRGLIAPIVIAVMFFNYYRKLQHVKEQIASVQSAELKAAQALCKTLVRKKVKDEPWLLENTNRNGRVQLMADKAFFIQRDLMRAFVVPKDQAAGLIARPEAKTLRLEVAHPLGKLTYAFDRKNSDKVKAWLAAPAAPTA